MRKPPGGFLYVLCYSLAGKATETEMETEMEYQPYKYVCPYHLDRVAGISEEAPRKI